MPDYLTISPSVPITPYRDGFGNWCSMIVAPAGRDDWLFAVVPARIGIMRVLDRPETNEAKTISAFGKSAFPERSSLLQIKLKHS